MSLSTREKDGWKQFERRFKCKSVPALGAFAQLIAKLPPHDRVRRPTRPETPEPRIERFPRHQSPPTDFHVFHHKGRESRFDAIFSIPLRDSPRTYALVHNGGWIVRSFSNEAPYTESTVGVASGWQTPPYRSFGLRTGWKKPPLPR